MGTLDLPIVLGAGGGDNAIALDLLIILACAGIVAAVFGRFKIAAIPGYLIAGAILGETGLLPHPDSAKDIAGVAIVLLMFTIGLHLDLETLRRGAGTIITIGVVTTLVTAGVLGLLCVPLLGLDPRSAIAVGMALSMSSTAVVMRLLQSRRELYSPHGRLSFGVLIVQDLLVIAMLAVMPLLAQNQDGGADDQITLSEGMIAAGRAVGGIAVMLFVGRLVLGKAMAFVVRWGGPEVLLVFAAAIALAAAGSTLWLGLSPELGAFLAGILLNGTPFRHHLSGQLAPIRDLFLVVFFTTVGLDLDVRGVLPELPGVLALIVGLVIVKSVVIGAVSWASGASAPVSVRAGLGLAQAGEFSLVVLSAAIAAGAISEEQGSPVIAVVVLSLIITPFMLAQTHRVSSLVSNWRDAPWRASPDLRETDSSGEEAADDDRCRVIVAGFGPIGRACVDRLEKLEAHCTIVEMNPATVRTQAGLGRSAIFGDISNPEVLESAGLDHADAVVLTMPDTEAILVAVRRIRSLRGDVFIATRSAALSQATIARESGADLVTVEEIATAQAMAEQLIDRIGAQRRARETTAEG